MLSKLFGSKARVKLLKKFLFQSDKKYYVRQLSRELGLQVNSIRRELTNLEKFGLLISDTYTDEKSSDKKISSRQEKKYYRVNEDFPLIKEIGALIIHSHSLYNQEIIDKLSEIGNLSALILTGLFVDQVDFSTDLLAIGEFDRAKFIKVIKEFEEDLGREINFTFMSPREFNYRRRMSDTFLYSILENKNVILVNKGRILD